MTECRLVVQIQIIFLRINAMRPLLYDIIGITYKDRLLNTLTCRVARELSFYDHPIA